MITTCLTMNKDKKLRFPDLTSLRTFTENQAKTEA